MELERELTALAAEIDWPPTPPLRPGLAARGREPWRPLAAALTLAVIALAVAFAVPASRAAILRFLHLGAVRIELVQRLPAAQERPLGARLGPTVDRQTAAGVLHAHLLLPPLSPPPPLHAANEIVSLLFRDHGTPVLLSETYDQSGALLKKLVGGETTVHGVRVGPDPGFWLSGRPHVFFFPGAPPRLAGNVLLWQHGPLTLRLEGHDLTEAHAQAIARALR